MLGISDECTCGILKKKKGTALYLLQDCPVSAAGLPCMREAKKAHMAVANANPEQTVWR